MAIRQLLEGRVKTLYVVLPKGSDILRSKQMKFVERKHVVGNLDLGIIVLSF